MTYKELPSDQRNHANGVLANYINTFIRTHQVWTAEQAYEDFCKTIYERREKGWYKESMPGNLWLTSDEAKDYIIGYFEERRRSHPILARRPAPVEERLRFGREWEGENFYDINWGLQDDGDYERADTVEEMDLTPWSINHVEKELRERYGKDLLEVLQDLSRSSIEERFYQRWIDVYYADKENPALIPEACGSRRKFECYKDTESGEYFFENDGTRRHTNVRFDFAVINYGRQRKFLIELDGQDTHKTTIQRGNDAVKRDIVENLGWQVEVFTGTQVMQDLDAVFQSLDDILRHH